MTTELLKKSGIAAALYVGCLLLGGQYVSAQSSAVNAYTGSNVGYQQLKELRLQHLSQQLTVLRQLEKQRLVLEQIANLNRNDSKSILADEALKNSMSLTQIREELARSVNEAQSILENHESASGPAEKPVEPY